MSDIQKQMKIDAGVAEHRKSLGLPRQHELRRVKRCGRFKPKHKFVRSEYPPCDRYGYPTRYEEGE